MHFELVPVLDEADKRLVDQGWIPRTRSRLRSMESASVGSTG